MCGTCTQPLSSWQSMCSSLLCRQTSAVAISAKTAAGSQRSRGLRMRASSLPQPYAVRGKNRA